MYEELPLGEKSFFFEILIVSSGLQSGEAI